MPPGDKPLSSRSPRLGLWPLGMQRTRDAGLAPPSWAARGSHTHTQPPSARLRGGVALQHVAFLVLTPASRGTSRNSTRDPQVFHGVRGQNCDVVQLASFVLNV